MTLVSTLRCMIHFGNHLSGFVKDPKPLQRMSYSEKQPEIEL